MITLPQLDEMRQLLQEFQDTQCGERHLPAEIEKLAGQEFDPQGFALVLLCAAKAALRKTYGDDKSMGSLEGLALVGNILPKYIQTLTPDEATAREVIKETGEQLFLMI